MGKLLGNLTLVRLKYRRQDNTSTLEKWVVRVDLSKFRVQWRTFCISFVMLPRDTLDTVGSVDLTDTNARVPQTL